jgi:hypothetical protein
MEFSFESARQGFGQAINMPRSAVVSLVGFRADRSIASRSSQGGQAMREWRSTMQAAKMRKADPGLPFYSGRGESI